MVADQQGGSRARPARARAHGRDGGDPRRRQPRRVRRRAARAGRGGRRDPRRRRGGAARLPAAPRARSAATCPAPSRWWTSAAARPRSPSARSPAASRGRARSRSARACWPTSTCARIRRRRPRCEAMRAHAAAVLAEIELPRPDAAVAVGGSAASLPRLVGRRAASRARSGARSACSRARRRRRSRSASRSTPSASGCCRPGSLILDAASHRLGRPAADRARRAARGRAAGAGRGWDDRRKRMTDIDDRRRDAGLDLDDPSLYFNRELSWLQFNERVLELAEDPAQPAAGAAEVLRDRLQQPRRVLHGPGRGPARPDRRRHRGSAAGRPHAERDDRRACAARCADHMDRQAACLDRQIRPALAEHGIRIVGVDEVSAGRARAARRALQRGRSSRC